MSKMKFRYRIEPKQGLDWWESLTILQKVAYKRRFEVYRNRPDVIKRNYPNMYDMREIRLSQLGNKHIIRIWVFKDVI